MLKMDASFYCQELLKNQQMSLTGRHHKYWLGVQFCWSVASVMLANSSFGFYKIVIMKNNETFLEFSMLRLVAALDLGRIVEGLEKRRLDVRQKFFTKRRPYLHLF